MLYIGLYREKHEKIFLSETIRPRALIYGMKLDLLDLYQVCLNYAPGAKNDPALWVTCFTYTDIGRNMKKSSCLKTIRPRALIFGM